jgi:hypothetical protein
MELSICERFPSLSPFDVRREQAKEVFLLIRRLNDYSDRQANPKKPRKIRRPASDNWF